MHHFTQEEVAAALGPPLTPLLVALWNRDRSEAIALIDAGVDPNAVDTRPIIGDGLSPLHLAVDDSELIRVLIAAGADVNAQSLSGRTALWLSCNDGLVATTSELLVAGADPNIRCREGYTPLGRVYASDPTLIELVRSYGGVM